MREKHSKGIIIKKKKEHVKGIYFILIWILLFYEVVVVVVYHGTKHISYFILFSFDLHKINKV